MAKSQGSQIQTSEPWPETQPHLKKVMGGAEDLFDAGKGFNPFPGRTFVGMSDPTQDALKGILGAAGKEGLGREAVGVLNQMMDLPGGGLTTRGGYQGLLRKPGASFGDDYAAMSGSGPDAIARNLSGVAGGGHTVGTLTNLEELYGRAGASGAGSAAALEDLRSRAGNEAFGRVINEQAGDLTTDINRGVSGLGRYGSGFHAGILSKEVGDFRDRMASNNWQQNVANERGLLNDIVGVNAGTLGQQQGLLGDMRGVRQTDLGNRVNAAGMLSGEQQQSFANRMGILGARAGQEQLGFENRRGVLNDITGVEQAGINNRFGMLDRVGGAQDALYDRFDRMGQAGSAYDDLNTRKLQSELDAWNALQGEDWARLGAYSGFAGGQGGMGGTTTSTVTQPSNPWGGLLGGGMAGMQLGGPFGGLLGGGLGLLSGLF